MFSVSLPHTVMLIGMVVPTVALIYLFRPTNTSVTGIEGWLAFFALSFVQVGCTFLSLLFGILRQRHHLAAFDGGLLLYRADVTLYFGLTFWTLLTAHALFGKRAVFAAMFELLWRMAGISIMLDALVTCLLTETTLDDFLTSAYFCTSATIFAELGLWRLYVRKSVRVRNTMVL